MRSTMRAARGSWVRLLVVVVSAGVLGTTALAAAPAAPSASDEDIARLVRQLGSARFAEREQATRQLTAIGIAAKDALTGAADDPDRELRARAREVLARVCEEDFRNRLAAFSADYDGRHKQTLPGWERFAEKFGTGQQGRRLFVEMQREEPALMEAYAEGGKAASEALDQRCENLLEQFTYVSSRETLFPLGTAAALLLVGSAEDVQVNEQLGVQLYTWMIYQPGFSKLVRGGAWSGMMKKLLGQWIVKDASGATSIQNLVLSATYELKPEGLELAGRILASETGNPQQRQFALLAVARFGNQEHLGVVEKFLSDATPCGAIQINDPPRQVDVQIRDVALAALIHLTDQQASGYGAVSAQASPQSIFQVPALGFVSAADRDAALARWSQWRAEHDKP